MSHYNRAFILIYALFLSHRSAIYNYLLGNPISTYGENLLIVAQTILIICMMWNYAKGDGEYGYE